MKLILFVILGILTLSNATVAQSTTDYCRVTTSVMSISEKRGTGVFVIGEFRPTSLEDITEKSFKHEESELTVDVEVDYMSEKDKPYEINLTLDVYNKDQKVLNPADTIVEAATSYGKRWGRIKVSKQITIGDLVYYFVFTCNDGSRKSKDYVIYAR